MTSNLGPSLCCCLAGRSWSWKRSWRLWATIWNLWKSVSKRYLVWPHTKHFVLFSHAAIIHSEPGLHVQIVFSLRTDFVASFIQFQTIWYLFRVLVVFVFGISCNVNACLWAPWWNWRSHTRAVWLQWVWEHWLARVNGFHDTVPFPTLPQYLSPWGGPLWSFEGRLCSVLCPGLAKLALPN